MVRKLICNVICVGVVLALTIPAAAFGEGVIRFRMDPGDMAATNGEVTVYYVGVPSEDGYRITEEFGGGMVKGEDVLSPFLARWLAQTEGKVGVTQALDADGQTDFVGMPDGLYLLEQTKPMDGFYSMEPVMVFLPYNGERDIQVSPEAKPIMAEEAPHTGEHLNPVFSAMIMVLSGMGLVLCVGKKRKE